MMVANDRRPNLILMNNLYTSEFLNRDYTSILRGLCMIAIVFSHTANEFSALLAEYHIAGLLICGRLATGIFFFLSGYGLTLSIQRNSIDRSYVVRHLRHLLLPYLIFWIFYIVVGLLTQTLPTDISFYTAFFFLRMPYVDAWFFKTIIGIYIVYFFLARFVKARAGICISIIIIVYAMLLSTTDVSSFWWNTIMCFPLGILCANHIDHFKRMVSWKAIIFLLCLAIAFYKLSFPVFLGEAFPPLAISLFCAFLSMKLKTAPGKTVIAFIGQNSLYMYLMEEIPIDFISSAQTGFLVFVIGGIIMTILLSYTGKKTETLIMRICTPRSGQQNS